MAKEPMIHSLVMWFLCLMCNVLLVLLCPLLSGVSYVITLIIIIIITGEGMCFILSGTI